MAFVSAKSSPGMIQYGFGACTVETHPAGEDIPFGRAVTVNQYGQAIRSTDGNVHGIAVHSHIACASGFKYVKGQPVPVLTHGVITVQGDGAIARNAKLNYDAAKSSFVATGGAATANLTVVAKEQSSGTGLLDVFVQVK